ncbi:hypothetical protein ACH4OY_22995 [Micromonospora rubida]|uniref:PH domain-containing protein n=1 Tax=Micromonospora rubida TaxID=2697657 RepID=A0ABW7SRL6_9ACTN
MPAMIDAFVVRRRRPILVIVLVATAALVLALLLQEASPKAVDLFAVVAGSAAVLLVLSMLSWGRSRPAVLVVQRRAFRAPQSATDVYFAAAYVVLLCLPIAMLSSSSVQDLAWRLVSCLVWAYLAALRVVDAWRGTHLHLRSEGIEERTAQSSLFVPWDALRVGHPQRPSLRAHQLTLSYSHPHRVGRRGLGSWKRLRIDTVHPWFIADVMRHYAEHAEHRAAIGTPDEYRRLLGRLADGTVPPYPDDNP